MIYILIEAALVTILFMSCILAPFFAARWWAKRVGLSNAHQQELSIVSGMIGAAIGVIALMVWLTMA